MNESNIRGLSVRAVLVFLLTLTVCVLTGYIITSAKPDLKIPEPLYSGFMLGLGFYFGQKTSGGSNEKNNTTSSDSVNSNIS